MAKPSPARRRQTVLRPAPARVTFMRRVPGALSLADLLRECAGVVEGEAIEPPHRFLLLIDLDAQTCDFYDAIGEPFGATPLQ